MRTYNKAFLILSLIVFQANYLWASVPTWSVNPSNYSYNMTITGVIYINGSESDDVNDIIAGFNGSECIGVANLVYNAALDKYVYYLMIYSNTASQVVNFKIYDASDDAEIDVEETVQFVIDGTLGRIDEPYVSSEDILNTTSTFLTFAIPGEKEQSQIWEDEITILMPDGSDLTNLSPEFTLDLYATAKVNGIVQYSGISAQDFTNSVIYEVTGVNGSSTTVYEVKVSAKSLIVFDAYNIFSPNGDGKNEIWKVMNHEDYRNCKFYMYYSTGHLVWESTGYNNDWDGTANGVKLPSGTYYYVVKCEECLDCEINGSVTLIR